MEMLLSGLFNPALAFSNILRRFPMGTFKFRLALDGMMRPNYGYALMCAADQARNLAITKNKRNRIRCCSRKRPDRAGKNSGRSHKKYTSEH